MITLTLDLTSTHLKRKLEGLGKRAPEAGAILALAVTTQLISGDPLWAYQRGEIAVKAQPIIDLIRDVAEPIAYGCYLWALIRYLMGQRGEAVQMMKNTTWGFIGIQMLPWFFSIIKSIGDN